MPTANSITQLFGIDTPLIQAPMAGAQGVDMVVAVSEAGGLGSLPCAMLTPDQARNQIESIQSQTKRPFNVNFFCHDEVSVTSEHHSVWQQALAPYYAEAGLDPAATAEGARREPFSDVMCELIEEFVPAVVSFHFGLPAESLVARVKQAGCRVISSATTVEEARWLAANGCDAIIAQGVEAGGHRGYFLNQSMPQAVATQVGTFSLLPQVVEAVDIPVIAAGGIADADTVSAAFALGAAAVQIGTAFLYCDEALISGLHRDALMQTAPDESALTNLFSGRPARGLMNRVMRELGPLSNATPPFPAAGTLLAPLKAHHEKLASADFSSLWAGQGYALSREYISRHLTEPGSGPEAGDGRHGISAAALTRALAKHTRLNATG